MKRLLVLIIAGVLAQGLAGCGSETTTEAAPTTTGPTVVVQDAWVRATAGTDDPSMTGAFMTLENQGDATITLTAASSRMAKMTELHEMAVVEGKTVMQKVEGGLEIEPGQGRALMPGGNHVMLMGLTSELAPGDEVELTLEFSDGTTQELTAPVKEFTEEEPHYHDSEDAYPSMSPSGSPSS
jgi:copper(I)-binding protein